MRHQIPRALLATLFVACGGVAPSEEPLREPQAAAAPTVTTPDIFVDAPPPGGQLIFVGQQKAAQADQWRNAVFVPMSVFSVEKNGIPNELPSADSLRRSLEALGVRGGKAVIVGEPIPAGRAYAAFDYLGLGDRVTLLDGGIKALGEPPAAAATPAAESRNLPAEPRADIIVDAKWVHDRLNDRNVVILDARPPEEFSGEKPGAGITRPGHIPGARSLFWQKLVVSPENPRLKPEAELRALFEQAGVRPGSIVVAYCRTGGQASFLYTVARHLGYDVRMYDGSFIDWSRTDYPVER